MRRIMQGLLRRYLVFAHDIAWVPASVFAAFWLRFNLGHIPPDTLRGLFQLIVVTIPVHAASFWFFGCYRGIWRYASIPDLVRLTKAVVVGAIASLLTVFMIWRLSDVPRSVMVLYPLFLFGAVTAARLAHRIIRDRNAGNDLPSADNDKRALLVGAGHAGEMLVRDLERQGGFIPVAFVDDNPRKWGHEVRGVRVRGKIEDIPKLIQKFEIEAVLITMPSASREVLDRVVEMCAAAGVKCRTLPSLAELANGRVTVSRLRPVTVEDLLGRDPVQLDGHSIGLFLKAKRVLVTGGGGSIGSELCRQIGRHDPGVLLVLDNSEYNLYRIDHDLATSYPALVFNSILGDVRDPAVVRRLFAQFKPQVVFHAAAYKHVPMVEDNIVEGVRNNVFGTKVVADAAKEFGVETFVLISTDKTVNPTNVMGTTKRIAELYCQALNEPGRTHFITTRFGNVLSSTGSVVPLFERQIAAGGPVTVTHPEITRYFMTIPEAASLILQAGAIGRGGEIFVLDMGEPVRILDLAEKMIRLSGLQPGKDIKIEHIGLRPGEKLHEELFYEKEKLSATVHPKLMLASCCETDQSALVEGLARLAQAVEHHDADRALRELKALVPEFNHNATGEARPQRRAQPLLKLVQ